MTREESFQVTTCPGVPGSCSEVWKGVRFGLGRRSRKPDGSSKSEVRVGWCSYWGRQGPKSGRSRDRTGLGSLSGRGSLSLMSGRGSRSYRGHCTLGSVRGRGSTEGRRDQCSVVGVWVRHASEDVDVRGSGGLWTGQGHQSLRLG